MRTRLALILILALLLAIASSAAAQSRRGELRGAWLSFNDETDWAEVAQSLQDSGFNAIFLQVADGPVARYASGVLPVRLGDADADTLAEAIAALREHGLESHAVGIGLAAHGRDRELLESYREAGRLQCAADGAVVGDQSTHASPAYLLCPSHPDNRKLLRDAAVELVGKYGISGVGLPGSWFLPDPETCFCEGCRERFQRATKIELADWPADVQAGGKHAAAWQQWRREVSISLGEEISDAVQSQPCVAFIFLLDPLAWSEVAESSDAHRQSAEAWSETRDAWIHGGTLDFICPMSVGSPKSASRLQTYVAELRGRLPVYPDLYAGTMTSVWQLIEQIEAVRAAGADGFVVRGVSKNLAGWLPDLRATVTAADPDPMPHGNPPVSFAFSGEAVAPPAEANRVITGARLEAEIALGWEPPTLPEDDSAAAAAQAGAMLERALDVRDPVGSYDTRPGLAAAVGDEERLTGRVFVESPQGATRLLLGPFDTAYQFSRTLGFPAPKGAFRIAIYGTLKTPTGSRDFVVRSPLLVGVSKEDLQASSLRGNLNEIIADACGHPALSRLASTAPLTIQIRATGPAAGDWWLALKDEDCETGAGLIESSDLTLTASAEDFLALALGETSPKVLWETGRLDIAGEDEIIARLFALYSEK